MKLATALLLAAAGSLVAAQAGHHHVHRHQHKRDIAVTTVVSPDVVYVYQLDGADIPVSDVCHGIKDGIYKWADGTAPAGACVTSTSSATHISAAVFFETLSTSTTSTHTTTSTTTTHTTPTTTSLPPPPPPPPKTTTTTTSSSSPIAVASPPPQPSSNGSGGVTIKNNMGQTIYLWTTTNIPEPMVTLPNGQTYQENWKINPDAGGVSIKISTTPSEADIFQYEYTLIGTTIWWDVSLINMAITSLFDTLGFTVTSDNPNCLKVNCPAGDTQCNDAYLFPTDDQATRACEATTNMVLNLGLA